VACTVQTIGAGGAGGAAGFALRKNGKTVTLNNSGTVAGSVG
jgi:NADPH-dependent glutamate synthase beta subunit-like oxidoreductase